MKGWILIIAIMPTFPLAQEVPDDFSKDDYLFVKARIIGYGPRIRTVEAEQVMDTGKVTLFKDIVIEALGKSTSEITDQLIDSLEQRTGRRSKTIEIMKVPAENPKKATPFWAA